ncbi:EAL domain-containing protein [Bradyrhizobium sp. U87765 SZCCT0131]|uniref:bifunctional diguanylate cyclase/phosphodiesterase n=1 Tax=unclassified Bradyrhizobium TaxID=2631580 RepID=UPI001BA97F95|nr:MULTISPECIES: EAL domain-containing protein [unclassified Bradyrhizobium]MBR1218627.1 EAL domain-containing protein [Bradyrhizobium sp. U87765 SZCCT0131]MBR1265614.1 EAL domain-containing protein [Bradyrhizobium sp. U87765 SZCCT0134]MBR1304125.1 EAL domain-containing protein [Bradyrhizobium sp. U87765 SZCCT0110]MBR1319731.1 EAL domain-containing protein [Bradyrhizobium sp. U87765 SZCCT0109]MBR1348056.1 EAL domain-containing protein [Bradyrhizobium sp. U87765 SZCCT0048]
MFKVYNCIVTAHDLSLVALAAVICALASFAAVNLLRHARGSRGRMRDVWLMIAAISTGSGIWATHFIAMLAFSPGIPNRYNIILTLASLILAMLMTGAGLAVSLLPNWRPGPWLGGAIVGGGIAAMHYTGMAAFEIQGIVFWDHVLVPVSIALGAVLGAVALPVALSARSQTWKAAGALLLTLAIVSHHFTAMGAVSIIPDPTIPISELTIPTGWLAAGVAIASFSIILLALAGVALDIHDRRRSELESDRMQSLANAAVEGLVLISENAIVTVNNSFARLSGYNLDDLAHNSLSTCFPDVQLQARLLSSSDQPIETELHHRNGAVLPVEVILRPMNYGGRPHHVIAVRDLRARKEAERHIRYLAHHDALTSLPNRSHFNARLDQEITLALARGERLAVLCLDLDRFKEINDLFGHAAGDKVLQTVAERVTTLLGERQMMARLGGDEFAILVPELAGPTTAGRLAEDVLDALRQEIGDSDPEGILCSIGIALFPDDARDREGLLTHADTALYRAKTEGRSTFRFFEAKMGVEVRDRRELEHDLRHATARGELRLVYQPQQDIQNHEVTGFEALLRWHHPQRGLVSPATFIPIAEETGSIIEIGNWVLREACREAASWSRPLTIAINVSAVQIHSANFAQIVHQTLLETGLSPGRLEIEITETALVRDLNRALTTLRQIKAFGIRIAMDDFGTGYSSLSNLRAFPFDKIKIDRSFITSVNANEQAATIVRAVLGLGRGLGLPVLAEGVETSDELSFLRSEHCDEVQGYLVGKPSAIDVFRNLTHDEPAAIDTPPVTATARVA